MARLLVEYGVRTAKVADVMIDLARRVATPPPWLARHVSRLRSANRDVLVVGRTILEQHLATLA